MASDSSSRYFLVWLSSRKEKDCDKTEEKDMRRPENRTARDVFCRVLFVGFLFRSPASGSQFLNYIIKSLPIPARNFRARDRMPTG